MSERSAEERETARLERERRRAQRVAGPSAPTQDAEPVSDAPATADVEEAEPPAQPEPELDQVPVPADPEPFDDADDDEPDAELPAGTKRVSQRERLQSRDGKRPPIRQRKRKPARNKPRRVPRERRGPSRGGRILSLIALVIAGVVIWFLFELYQPFSGSPHGHVTVTIPARASSSQVGDLLEREGVISSSFFFELRATLDGDRSDLRSGTYHLQLGMSYADVLKRLTTAPKAAKVTNLTIVEGRTRRQIDALLRSQHIHGSYLAATRHSRYLDPHHYGAPRSTPSLEGFLFPSTYQLREPIDIQALVKDQLTTFKQQFGKVNLSFARSKNLTPYDVLIIASIIEEEAATSHDLPLVASVVYNRLKDHMPLGMDSTTRYEFNDYTKPLTSSQLNANSPYNTRRNLGLPPTPIGNPGMSAIQAAAHPSKTRYLYFVARVCGNGSSVFETNYQQFLRDSAKYQSARAKRGGSPTHC